SIDPNAVISTTGIDGYSRRTISSNDSPSSGVFMRMSLSRRSGGCWATASSAASPLFAKTAPKPSRAKTSQSSSHVTASSSTVRICGILRGIQTHLSKFRRQRLKLHRRQDHSKLGASLNFHAVDPAAVFENDLAGNCKTEAAAGLFGGPHRLKQMVLRFVADACARVDQTHF